MVKVTDSIYRALLAVYLVFCLLNKMNATKKTNKVSWLVNVSHVDLSSILYLFYDMTRYAHGENFDMDSTKAKNANIINSNTDIQWNHIFG